MFFDYWTLKEAYIKARGAGLAIPLDLFSFRFDGRGRISVSFDPRLGDDPERWQFALYRPTGGHVLAVALERESGPACEVELCQVSPWLAASHTWQTPRSPCQS